MRTDDGINTLHGGSLVESVIVKLMLIPGLNLLLSLCGVMGCAVLNWTEPISGAYVTKISELSLYLSLEAWKRTTERFIYHINVQHIF